MFKFLHRKEKDDRNYVITWITPALGAGHAPMSWAELDEIREQGISAIINLCEEFSDLHELEADAGFEVFYLPTTDDTPPDMEKLDEALEWMDEAIYLGKKVLVHCKHGVGRTGTFLMAYLLRRGFTMRQAEKLLKKTRSRANPTNFSQWGMLRKFGRKEGKLKYGEPSAENRRARDVSGCYQQYEDLQQRVEKLAGNFSPDCTTPFSLTPMEAIYFNERINISLTAAQRRAVTAHTNETSGHCPLWQDDRCILHKFRPLHCRGVEALKERKEIDRELQQLSRKLFTTLLEMEVNGELPLADRNAVISGKYVEIYFTSVLKQQQSS
jgi:protein-tyrosine phosphatase/Fe-S-cluster containining protein